MIVEFCRALKALGVETGVAVFEGGGSLETAVAELGVPVYQLHKRDGLAPGLVTALRALCRQHGYNRLHTNNYAAWLYAALAALALPGAYVVHTEHSNVRGGKWRRHLAEKVLSLMTRHIVAVSQKVKDAMVAGARIPEQRIQLITNGIDTDSFQPDAERGATVRQQLGLHPGDLVVGTVGRLVPVKDHGLLIRSFARVVTQLPKARLVIVGDGPLRESLSALVAELKLQSQVLLLGERSDAAELLKSFDLYVVSSKSEGMSISLLEAMSSALPVVATAVGGNPELVSDDVNGLLVPRGDEAALAEAMAALLAGPDRARALGRAGRQVVLAGFSQQRMLQEYLALYQLPPLAKTQGDAANG